MPRTTNYGWFLPDWEISSGQNAAIEVLDSELYSLTNISTIVGNKLTALETTLGAGGTVTVLNGTITSANTVLYSRSTAAGVTLGNISYTIVDNTSLTFTSDNAADLSTIVYIIL